MKKFYLDTNIWLDYFENRSDGLRPLGEFAFQFLKDSLNFNCEIYYSNFTLFELKNKINEKEFTRALEFIKKNLIFIESTKQDWKEAQNLSKKTNLHSADALHLVIAKKNDCTLITRDKHFDSIDLIEIKRPEEVLF
ncbi:MAG: PIN domain-containing protein, partial [Candidatus ainarchaeum sp.]|nr:PIN domain-containing protein [Candidatus ainarchaeum sp.]